MTATPAVPHLLPSAYTHFQLRKKEETDKTECSYHTYMKLAALQVKETELGIPDTSNNVQDIFTV